MQLLVYILLGLLSVIPVLTIFFGSMLPFSLGNIQLSRSNNPIAVVMTLGVAVGRWVGFMVLFAVALIFIAIGNVIYLIAYVTTFDKVFTKHISSWAFKSAKGFDQTATAMIGGNEDLTISGWLGSKDRDEKTMVIEKIFMFLFNILDFTTAHHFRDSIEEDENV